MAQLKQLLELKEDLKKESASEDASDSRLTDILQEIRRCCESISREIFVESKIGGIVKKVSEGQQNQAAAVAKELMEKWRIAFSKTSTPASTSTTITSPKPLSTAKLAEIARLSGPQDAKRQKTCAFLTEAFAADIDQFPAEVISNVCIEIEESMYKIGQDQYVSKGRALRLNLPKNRDLRHQVLNGEIKGDDLVNYSSDELLSAQHKQLIEQGIKAVEEAKRSDWLDANREQFNKQAGIKEMGGMYKCGKCGSTKTAYYQKQTRSAGKCIL